MLRLHAPAKINLFLRILAQERSGFHQLETLFCSLEFGDTVILERASSGVTLEIDGPDIGPLDENLVYRAAKEFLQAGGLGEGVKIRLEKRIPMGAGLGGGSSDAGTTLLGLQELYPGAVDGDRLLGIAGSLGSDVPFFLSSSSLALAWGRGDRLQPLMPLPSATVLLACPPLEVPTQEAYNLLAREREGVPISRRPNLLSPYDLSSWERLGLLAVNDFEEVVLREYPDLQQVRKKLQESGSFISLLAGSGSALFGVFGDDQGAVEARSDLEDRFPETVFVLTRTEVRAPDLRMEPGVEPEVGY